MAHALTLARLLLALPFGLLMAQAAARRAMLAALVLAVAIATDLLDGPLARRRGTVTPAGAAFDHTADCLFVTSGLAGGASRGTFPWALPVLVAAAFVQYVLDSYWLHRGRALRASRLGRWNGVLYFVPPAIDILIRLGLDGLRPLLPLLAWGLVLSTLASMGARLWVLRAPPRTVPGSHAGGRRGPSPH
jgi:CDP-diacylglycerol--glycerol-3-phosphate 3-phosphatidyltransferase